jgi:hypothetical protein
MNTNVSEIVSMAGLSITLVASIVIFVYQLASVGLLG